MSEAVLLGCNVPHNPDRHIEALYNCMCLGLIALYENIYIGRPGSKGLRSITKEYGRYYATAKARRVRNEFPSGLIIMLCERLEPTVFPCNLRVSIVCPRLIIGSRPICGTKVFPGLDSTLTFVMSHLVR